MRKIHLFARDVCAVLCVSLCVSAVLAEELIPVIVNCSQGQLYDNGIKTGCKVGWSMQQCDANDSLKVCKAPLQGVCVCQR
jgi:hypothetical protein